MQPDVQQVADGVHFVEASNTNVVLVDDGDELLVIDTGYPRDRDLLVAAIDAIGRRVTDCTDLLLTHCHVDHSGSAEWLRQNADTTVRCHDDERAQVVGPIREQISPVTLLTRLYRPAVARFTMRAIMAGGLRRRNVAEVSSFDGDTAKLDVPGHPIAVHTPGHTRGHVAFHLPDRGVLISGDALITVDLWNEDDTAPQCIGQHFNHDDAAARASLDRLAPLEAEVILPGHGRPWRGSPADAVALARTH